MRRMPGISRWRGCLRGRGISRERVGRFVDGFGGGFETRPFSLD